MTIATAMSDAMSNVAVKLHQLRFSWKANDPLLAIDDLTIQRGERVFLQGPSGSGKSTLLSLLGGVLVPQAGCVEVLGNDLATLSAAQRDRFRADHMGFVFQQFNLLPFLSVRENVQLPGQFSARRRRAVAARGTAKAEADRLLWALNLNSDRIAEQRAGTLSVGQQQRVAVARALYGEPQILIADEPTSSLDAETRAVFLQLLFDECRRTATTVIFVSHDLGLAPLFDRSVRLAAINRVPGHGTATP